MWKQSTQLKYWFFTAEKLNEIRAQTNASAEEKEEKVLIHAFKITIK